MFLDSLNACVSAEQLWFCRMLPYALQRALGELSQFESRVC